MIDWSLTGGFRRNVLEATARIPSGHVITYGALAAEVGKPSAARAVGNAVGSNPVAIVVPCHRVVPASGGVADALDDAHRLVPRYEREAAGQVARVLLVIGAAQSARLDPEHCIIVAMLGHG